MYILTKGWRLLFVSVCVLCSLWPHQRKKADGERERESPVGEKREAKWAPHQKRIISLFFFSSPSRSFSSLNLFIINGVNCLLQKSIFLDDSNLVPRWHSELDSFFFGEEKSFAYFSFTHTHTHIRIHRQAEISFCLGKCNLTFAQILPFFLILCILCQRKARHICWRCIFILFLVIMCQVKRWFYCKESQDDIIFFLLLPFWKLCKLRTLSDEREK